MESIDTNFQVLLPDPLSKDNSYLTVVSGNQDNTTILDCNLDARLKTFTYLKHSQQNENFLIEATRNFIKKQNFSELNELLDEGEITEEEYEIQLKDNPEKYFISLKNINSPDEVIVIANLVKRIGLNLRDFSTSEVSEMFSVKENQLISHVNNLRNVLK